MERDAALAKLEAVRSNPGSFLADSLLADLAREILRQNKNDEPSEDILRESPLPFPIWGTEQIDPEAIKQMENAMRLPVTVTGALMPDAHVGYGLPIGGVLATENVVIPYAVGVDIACRMRLSLYEISPILIGQKKGMFENALWDETAFGMGAAWKGNKRAQHEVLDDDAWYATRQLTDIERHCHEPTWYQRHGQSLRRMGQFHASRADVRLEGWRIPCPALTQRLPRSWREDRRPL
jgi:tRNA-splicing ligase RtcB (3'-phosphate/5'-hydroxy nucleic acid ligase)